MSRVYRTLLICAFSLLAVPILAQEATDAPEPQPEVTELPNGLYVISPNPPANPITPISLIPEVIETRAHDPESYTQGLELFEGRLFESAGEYGFSDVREVDPLTGEVLRQVALRADIFAEGLTRVGDRLIQLTWREGIAIAWDIETFEPIEVYPSPIDGWGLCYDGEQLYQSDGSSYLYIRNAETFQIEGAVGVYRNGVPVLSLNELECVGDLVYANVWQTDEIVVIDKRTGQVTATIDARDLLTAEERAAYDSRQVLNGIAYDADADNFLITGKEWNTLYVVHFVEGVSQASLATPEITPPAVAPESTPDSISPDATAEATPPESTIETTPVG